MSIGNSCTSGIHDKPGDGVAPSASGTPTPNAGSKRYAEPIPDVLPAPAQHSGRPLLIALGVAGLLVACILGAVVVGVWHVWGQASAVVQKLEATSPSGKPLALDATAEFKNLLGEVQQRQEKQENEELRATVEQLRAALNKQHSDVLALVQAAQQRTAQAARAVTASTPFAPPLSDPPAPSASPPKWTILFRADDPSVWNTESYSAAKWALPLQLAPEDMRYVRLRRLDTNEYLILPLSRYELQNGSLPSSEAGYWWNGTAKLAYGGHHLGIVQAPRFKFVAPRGMIDVMNDGWDGFSGSGFGHADGINDRQHYCWRGKEIMRTIFEIAVNPGPLTAAEGCYLLPRR
jgi:hypothetical protein